MTSIATGQVRKVVANESGQYLFPSLPIGAYALAVEQPAFKRYERTGILLQANENVKVDIALEVGDVKTTIAVDAAASQVEVRSSTIKETVDQARVIELPLNGRNAADLALLATGVTAFGSDACQFKQGRQIAWLDRKNLLHQALIFCFAVLIALPLDFLSEVVDCSQVLGI